MIENALVKRAKRGTRKKLPALKLLKIEEARAEVVEKISKLVHKFAQRYRKKVIYITYDELYQEGMCGVMVAIEKFDPKHKVRFSSYASWWIRQAMQRAMMMKNQPIIRRKCMDHTYTKFEAFFEDDVSKDVGDEPTDLGALLEQALSCLNKRDSKILKLRFYEHKTLQEIAEVIGITRERIRQIEFRALKRLYKFFDERGMRFFEDT